MNENKKVVILSPVLSHPVNSGNTSRVAQLASMLEHLGCEVHFVSVRTFYFSMGKDNSLMYERYGDRFYTLNQDQLCKGTLFNRIWMKLLVHGLKKYKVGQDTFWINQVFTKRNKKEFEKLVAKIQPDVIITEYAVLAPLVNELKDKSIKVVDTHDCFTDRNDKIRRAAGKAMWINLSSKQEKSLLSIFDYVLAIQSEEEKSFKALLADQSKKVRLLDIIDLPDLGVRINSVDPTIGFIGSNNFHNKEGLRAFINAHWSRILKAVPNTKLLIAGSVECDLDVEGVIHLGLIDDVEREFYDECSIVINPCITGSGLKIKTVEAMSYALPVVTTPEGASGLEDDIGLGLQVFDVYSDFFAKACIKLILDAKHRNDAAQSARQKVESRFVKSKQTLQQIVKGQ